MTVAELREQLTHVPQDATVVVRGYEWGHHFAGRVVVGVVIIDVNKDMGSLGGDHEFVEKQHDAYDPEFERRSAILLTPEDDDEV